MLQCRFNILNTNYKNYYLGRYYGKGSLGTEGSLFLFMHDDEEIEGIGEFVEVAKKKNKILLNNKELEECIREGIAKGFGKCLVEGGRDFVRGYFDANGNLNAYVLKCYDKRGRIRYRVKVSAGVVMERCGDDLKKWLRNKGIGSRVKVINQKLVSLRVDTGNVVEFLRLLYGGAVDSYEKNRSVYKAFKDGKYMRCGYNFKTVLKEGMGWGIVL